MRPPPGSERLEKAAPPHPTVETAAASGFGEAVTASLGFHPRGSSDGWRWRGPARLTGPALLQPLGC